MLGKTILMKAAGSGVSVDPRRLRVTGVHPGPLRFINAIILFFQEVQRGHRGEKSMCVRERVGVKRIAEMIASAGGGIEF